MLTIEKIRIRRNGGSIIDKDDGSISIHYSNITLTNTSLLHILLDFAETMLEKSDKLEEKIEKVNKEIKELKGMINEQRAVSVCPTCNNYSLLNQ